MLSEAASICHGILDDDSEGLRESSDDAPFAALAFKIATDPFVGNLTFFRVYSGTLASGTYVYNGNRGSRERLGRILRMHANKRERVDHADAGEIVGVVGHLGMDEDNPDDDAGLYHPLAPGESRLPSRGCIAQWVARLTETLTPTGNGTTLAINAATEGIVNLTIGAFTPRSTTRSGTEEEPGSVTND